MSRSLMDLDKLTPAEREMMIDSAVVVAKDVLVDYDAGELPTRPVHVCDALFFARCLVSLAAERTAALLTVGAGALPAEPEPRYTHGDCAKQDRRIAELEQQRDEAIAKYSMIRPVYDAALVWRRHFSDDIEGDDPAEAAMIEAVDKAVLP